MIYRSCPWFRIEIFNLLLLLRPNRLSLWNYDELTKNMLVLANSVPFHFLKKPMNKKISFYDEGIFIQIRNSNVCSLRVLIFLHCNHDFLYLSLLPFSFQWNRCKLRSGRLKVFCIKDILKNFEKFTGKHLCRSVFLIKRTAASNVIEKDALAQTFFCEFCEPFMNTYFEQHRERLLLDIIILWILTCKKIYYFYWQARYIQKQPP